MVGISSMHAVAAQEKPNPYSFYYNISNYTTKGSLSEEATQRYLEIIDMHQFI